MALIDRLTTYWKYARTVRRSTGVGLARQVLEIADARRWPNCLSPSEYYDHSLAGQPEAARRDYVGWKSPVIGALQPSSWHALANDKLVYYSYISSLGFDVPRLLAVYQAGARLSSAPVLRTRSELADFLRRNCTYPFYGKPVHGLYGIGNALCVDYDRQRDALIMIDGSEVTVDAFVACLPDRSGAGYLFQEVLQPSSDIAALWGGRLSTVRVVVTMTGSGPKTFMTEVKIPTGRNAVDNYADGKTGNLLALTDDATGRIIRLLVPGIGYTESTEICHPDTGRPLMGMVIPQWREVVELAYRAANAFPALRLQGWDITHTTRGLLPLELNLVTGRTAYNHQRFCRRGLLTDELRALL